MAFVDENGVVSLASDLRTFADATYPANAAIASVYDSTATYDIGDYCLYSGLLYKCNTAIEEGGEVWDSTHWTQVVLVNEKISKSGDTMTGTLRMANNNRIVMQENDYAIGETISSDTNYNEFAFRDKNNSNYAMFSGRFNTDGTIGLRLSSTRNVSGSTKQNVLGLYVDSSGNPIVVVSGGAAPAWRTALNAVNKAGDTMTGNLTLENAAPGVYAKATDVTDGVAPSESTNQIGFRIIDKNGTGIALFTDRETTAGLQGAWMTGIRNGIYNGLYLLVNSSGERVVQVSESAAWRDALNVVNKAGDTMTGPLIIQQEDSLYLTLKNTDIDISASTATAAKVMTFRGLDKNGRYVGWCQAAYSTAGRSNISLGARKYINSANVDNTLTLAVLADGTKTVSFSDSSIWRSALGVVNKSGDTMTGILKLSSSTTIANNIPARLTFEVTQTDNNVTYSNGYIATYDTHQTTSSGLNMVIQSGGNVIIGGGESPNSAYTNVYKDTSTEKLILTADNIIEIYTNAGTWANAVKTTIDTSGNFSGKAANVTGTVAIANGGTGSTAVSSVTTLSSIATAASGVTISVDEYHQWGKLASVRLELTKTAAISSNTLVATMVSGKRPVMDASAWMPEKTGAAWILKGGGIYVTGDFAANKNIVITSLFMLP